MNDCRMKDAGLNFVLKSQLRNGYYPETPGSDFPVFDDLVEGWVLVLEVAGSPCVRMITNMESMCEAIGLWE